MRQMWVLAGLACVLWGCGSEQSAGRLASTGDGQGEIVVPAGMMIDGLTLVQSPEPFLDVMFAPVGPGYLCGPSGQQFSQKVTLRLPITADLLAQHERGLEQVRIYTRSAGESRFHPLATRVDATGLKVEADVSHFSEFQVGVAVPHECLGQADEADCTVYVCQLAGFIAEQGISDETDPGDPPGTLSPSASLIAKAADACTESSAGDPAGALDTLAALEAELLAYLNSAIIDSFTYQEVLELVQDAQAALQRIPGIDPTGTWVGTLPIGGDDRPFAVQLHRRKDGTLMGYVLGGSRAWTVAGGWQGGDRVHFVLELNPNGSPTRFTVDGTIKPPSMDSCPNGKCNPGPYLLATVEHGEEVHHVMWTQTAEALAEQRYALWDPTTNQNLVEVAVAVSPTGTLVSGNYMSGQCSGDQACAGEVFGLVQPEGDSSHLRFMIDSYDNQGASIDLVYSESTSAAGPGYYFAQGTWQGVAPYTSLADPAPSGPLFGGQLMGTTSVHVAKMLATYGRLADDLAARKDFAYYISHPKHPSFLASYNHFGKSLDDLMLELASEATAFERVEVDFSRFTGLSTVAGDRTATVGTALGVDFHDTRTGFDGGRKVVYRDADTLPPYDRYRFLAFEGENVVIGGNQSGPDAFGMFLIADDLAAFGQGAARVEYPFGVHTRGSPLGTDDISVRFLQDPIRDVMASATSEVRFALGDGTGPTTCPQNTRMSIATQAGAYSLRYEGTTGCSWSWAEPIALVEAGAKIGTTILTEDQQQSSALRFQAGTDLARSFCPYWLLSLEARGQMLQMAQGMAYPEQLTEPFLCNARQGEQQVFPISQVWTRITHNNTANPDKIRFTRNGLDGQTLYTYEHLNASGQVVNQGSVTYIETEGTGPEGYRAIGLNPYDGGGSQGWVKVWPLSATSSVMALDVTGGQDVVNADDYNGASGAKEGSGTNCDDHNPCTDDVETSPGFCGHVNNRDPCSDGNPCTEGDHCQDGQCRGGDGNHCEDGNPCTVDDCDQQGNCSHHVGNEGLPCDDGNQCTTADTCSGGACGSGESVVCPSPQDECHAAGICDPLSGECSMSDAPDATDCNVPSSCLWGGKCYDGTCYSAGSFECPSAGPCQVPGYCNSATGLCQIVFKPNGTPCDDGDACTVHETCIDGSCSVASVTVCSPVPMPCRTVPHCDPTSGLCVSELLADGSPCDDGNDCTWRDTCLEGQCIGSDGGCDDLNPLTLDGCIDGACLHIDTPQQLSCDLAASGFCLEPVVNPQVHGTCIPSMADEIRCTTARFDNPSATCWGHCEYSLDTCTTHSDECPTLAKQPSLLAKCNASSGTCYYEPSDGYCESSNDPDGPAVAPEMCSVFSCIDNHWALVPREDGSPCESNCHTGTCQQGGCFAQAAIECDDNNPCTDDYCESYTTPWSHTCASRPNSTYTRSGCAWISREPDCFPIALAPGTWCDDEITCTSGDVCDGQGGCSGTANSNICAQQTGVPTASCVTHRGCEIPAAWNLEGRLAAEFESTVVANSLYSLLDVQRFAAWRALFVKLRSDTLSYGSPLFVRWDSDYRTPSVVGNTMVRIEETDWSLAVSDFRSLLWNEFAAVFAFTSDDWFDEEYLPLDATLSTSAGAWGSFVYRLDRRFHRDIEVVDDWVEFTFVRSTINPTTGYEVALMEASIRDDLDSAWIPPDDRISESVALSSAAALLSVSPAACDCGIVYDSEAGHSILSFHTVCEIGEESSKLVVSDVRDGRIVRVDGLGGEGTITRINIRAFLPQSSSNAMEEFVPLRNVRVFADTNWEVEKERGGEPFGTIDHDGMLFLPDWTQEPLYLDFSHVQETTPETNGNVERDVTSVSIPTVAFYTWGDWLENVYLNGYRDGIDPYFSAQLADENLVGRRLETLFILSNADEYFVHRLGWPGFRYRWKIKIRDGEESRGWGEGDISYERPGHDREPFPLTYYYDRTSPSDNPNGPTDPQNFRAIVLHEWGHGLMFKARKYQTLRGSRESPINRSFPRCEVPTGSDTDGCLEAAFVQWISAVLGKLQYTYYDVAPGTEYNWPEHIYPTDARYIRQTQYFLHNLWYDLLFLRGVEMLRAFRWFIANARTRDSVHMQCTDAFDVNTCKSPLAHGKNTMYQRFLDVEEKYPVSKRADYEISRAFHSRIADADPGDYVKCLDSGYSQWTDFRHGDWSTIQTFPWADDATNSPERGGDVLSADGCRSEDVPCNSIGDSPVMQYPTTPTGMHLTLNTNHDQDVFSFVGRKGMAYLPRVVTENENHRVNVTITDSSGSALWNRDWAQFWPKYPFVPSVTGMYRLVVSPLCQFGSDYVADCANNDVLLSLPPGPDFKYNVGIIRQGRKEAAYRSASVIARLGMPESATVGDGDEFDWYQINQLDQTARTITLTVTAEEPERIDVFLLDAASTPSDDEINAEFVIANDLLYRTAGGLSWQCSEQPCSTTLSSHIPLDRGVYYLVVADVNSGAMRPGGSKYELTAQLVGNQSSVFDVGDDAQTAVDIDAAKSVANGMERVFVFPTVGNDMAIDLDWPNGGIVQLNETLVGKPTSDEDWYAFRALEGQVVKVWVERVACRGPEQGPSAKIALEWMLGDGSVKDRIFNRTWMEPGDRLWRVHWWNPADNDQEHSYQERGESPISLMSEEMSVEYGIDLVEANRGATITFVVPAAATTAAGVLQVDNWVWVRARLAALQPHVECSYVLGIARQKGESFPSIVSD